MKFKFRLERVLDFYRLRETLMKMELARAVSAWQGLKAQKEQSERQLEFLLAESPKRLAMGGEWAPYGVGQIELTVTAIKRLEREIAKAAEAVEVKKFELARLSMRREALEKLREKRRTEFRLLESRKEQKFVDEIYQRSKWK